MKDSNSKQTTRNESRSTSSTRASHVNNPEGINQYSDKKGSNSSTSGTSTSKGTHNSTSKSTTGSSTRNSHVNNPEGINQYSDKKSTGSKSTR